MNESNGPSSTASPQGRRVLIAIVDGEPGAQIEAWRELHDREQARRLPPHTTLCYWADQLDVTQLEAQVRHAFAEPGTVHLGSVHEFDNDQHTFYVEVSDTESLDTARARLYDGTFVALPGKTDWTWHVTCVRESRGRELEPLREAAAGLVVDAAWPIRHVAVMELRGDRYESVASWQV